MEAGSATADGCVPGSGDCRPGDTGWVAGGWARTLGQVNTIDRTSFRLGSEQETDAGGPFFVLGDLNLHTHT